MHYHLFSGFLKFSLLPQFCKSQFCLLFVFCAIFDFALATEFIWWALNFCDWKEEMNFSIWNNAIISDFKVINSVFKFSCSRFFLLLEFFSLFFYFSFLFWSFLLLVLFFSFLRVNLNFQRTYNIYINYVSITYRILLIYYSAVTKSYLVFAMLFLIRSRLFNWHQEASKSSF